MLCVAMHSPAAVIFDCDGVLVDSEILAIEVEIALLAEYGERGPIGVSSVNGGSVGESEP